MDRINGSGFRAGSLRAMIKQQALLLWRYPVNMVANFVMVLVTVLIVTLIVVIFAQAETAAVTRSLTLYGVVIFLFLNHTIWAIGMGLHKEKAEGTLTSFYLSPTPPFLNLVARAAVALLWTSIAGAIGLLLAQLLVGPLLVQRPWLALVILLFVVSELLGLGFALAGLAILFGDSIEIVANVVQFGLIGLCSLFFPFSYLPPPLRAISGLVPLSYGVDAFRTVALGQHRPELLPLNLELFVVIAGGFLGPILGYWVYRCCETKVREQGML